MKLSLVPLCVWISLAVVLGQTILNLKEGEICKEETYANWTCKRLDDCPKAKKDIDLEIIPDQCIPNAKNDRVVCCEPLLAEKKCNEYAQYVFEMTYDDNLGKLVPDDRCRSSEPLIINGVDANPREFPHMALIGYGQRHYNNCICGGSLISERFVLSAAHCITGNNVRAYWVRLGDYKYQTTDDENDGSANSVEFGVERMIPHENYKSPNLYNDIALFKLDKNVNFNEYVRPLCLQTQNTVDVPYLLVSGWGVSYGVGVERKNTLQKANQTILSGRRCSDSYKDSHINIRQQRIPSGITYETMMCTEDTQNRSNFCKGDSGGPLQYVLRTPYCMYSLVGVTSFGDCVGNYPGVFTRVSNYVEWIEGIVWP